MKKIAIFASSTPEGQFKELIQANDYQIIQFLGMNNHGVNSVKLSYDDKIMVIHYVDMIYV